MRAPGLRLPQSAATIGPRLPLTTLMTLTFEDFPPGRLGTFGPRHVTREEMLAFAAEFDPQPMHLDEEAAKASMLQGLSGSGWHLCSIMMRMMFDGFIGRTVSMGSPGVNELRWLAPLRPGDDLMLEVDVSEARLSKSRPEPGTGTLTGAARNARGEEVAVWGPSPGFRDLRWIKPVLAGDTIHFASEIVSKRTSDKRPQWGIVQARNTGTNQRGEPVFSLLATAFVPRRGAA